MQTPTVASFFSPKRIAIIGASEREGSVGYSLVKNIVDGGYKGSVYPVNPHTTEILGLPCFSDLFAIPQIPDLAIIAVKAAIVPSVLDDCIRHGITKFVIISAGFKEVGGPGIELEQEVMQKVREAHGLLLGPNCLGFTNSEIHLNASFAPFMPPTGDLAFISQSGALATTMIDAAAYKGLGFSIFASIGNKSGLDETSVLSFLETHEKTKAILMYLEDIKDIRGFVQVAWNITHGAHAKPIIVCKAGRTSAGSKATSSHTGALATDAKIIDSALMQAGVIRADTIREMFDYASICTSDRKPEANVMVVTNAGGPGVLAIDATETYQCPRAELRPETIASLTKALASPLIHIANPLDLLGDAGNDRFERAFSVLKNAPEVGTIFTVLTPQLMTDVPGIAKVVQDNYAKSKKPFLATFLGGEHAVKANSDVHVAGIPSFSYPEEAIRAVAAYISFTKEQKNGHTPFSSVGFHKLKAATAYVTHVGNRESSDFLPADVVWSILGAYQIPLVPLRLITQEEQLLEIPSEFPGPYAMKIVSPDIIHKSDIGGVVLSVSEENLLTIYKTMLATIADKKPDARILGVSISPMAQTNGLECIVGAKRLPSGGAVIVVGVGGILVEIVSDTALGITPLMQEDAKRMIESLRMYPLLTGARGKPPYDIETLATIIGSVSTLMEDLPDIQEIDCNPVILYEKGKGAIVPDARIR